MRVRPKAAISSGRSSNALLDSNRTPVHAQNVRGASSGMEPEEREVAARFLPRSSYNLVNEDCATSTCIPLADGPCRRRTLVARSAR